jgi:hypothetical protein
MRPMRVDASTAAASTVCVLASTLLGADPMFQRIPVAARSPLVEAALSEGRVCAESVSHEWGTDPWIIAQRLGISVVESEADASFGGVIVFADYVQRPPTTTLYVTAIAGIQRRLAASRLWRTPHAQDCKSVFLAHELYHHLACMASEPRISRSYRVTLLRLGRWRWTSGIASLEEIAAGAFAQSLLGLTFHPRLLEVLWLQESVAQEGGAEP